MLSFAEKLEKLKDKIEGRMPEAYLNIMHKATAELEASGIQEKVLKVGQEAPNFKLKNQNEEWVNSSELLKDGPLVLSFYRGIWCPYCNLDLANLNKYLEEIKSLDAQLIALSPETPIYLQQTVNRQKLNYDLLHDYENQTAANFGLKFQLPEDLKLLYRDQFKIDLESHQNSTAWTLPMPARFIIDQNGIIQYAESHPDYRLRPAPDAILEILKNIQ